jgi:hypothetical protein
MFHSGSQLQVDAYLNQLLTGGWRALSELGPAEWLALLEPG